MDSNTRALLAQVMVGLGAVADAYDRLLDLEVVAYACQLADQMEAGIAAVLHAAPTPQDVASLREAIDELQSLVRERAQPDRRKEDIRRLARERWPELEIEADAHVAEDDDGAYVSAWVRVSFDGTPLDRR